MITSAISPSCSRVATPPVGLDGKLRKISFVRGVIAASISAPYSVKPRSSSGGRARDGADGAGERFVDGKAGAGVDHLVTGAAVGIWHIPMGGLPPGKTTTRRGSACRAPRAVKVLGATACRRGRMPWGSQ